VQLHDEILRSMSRMSKLHLSIERTRIKRQSDLVPSSNDVIQRSFIGGQFGSVGSHVDAFAKWHFRIISQSFPVLRRLHIFNGMSQESKNSDHIHSIVFF
jgi:hypothetical protein